MKTRMTRPVWVKGTALLLALLNDDLAIAKALKARRWEDLLAASEVAHAGVPPEMAVTDPAQYKAVRDATTLFFLEGYRCLSRSKLSSIIEAEKQPPRLDPNADLPVVPQQVSRSEPAGQTTPAAAPSAKLRRRAAMRVPTASTAALRA